KTPQCPERLAAMADGGLLIRRRFGERAAVRRIKEDRVVPETAAAARRGRDASLDGRARFEEDATRVGNVRAALTRCERERTDESSGRVDTAVVTKRAVDQRELFLVRRLDTAVARRFHAGCATKRVNLQTRVFGDGQLAARRRVVQRLGPRIFLECPSGLFGSVNRGHGIERD